MAKSGAMQHRDIWLDLPDVRHDGLLGRAFTSVELTVFTAKGMASMMDGILKRRWMRALAVAAYGLFATHAYAIDDSVLTEVNAYGLVTDVQLEHLKSRRKVVVIVIKDGKMEPRELHVTPNTVVVFENQDAEEKHFIYATPDPNNDLMANVLTEMIGPGGRWAATFTSGEYPFYCARHPGNEEEKGRIYSGT